MDEESISFAMDAYFREQMSLKNDGAEVTGLSSPHAAWLQSAEAPEGHRTLFWFHQDMVSGLNCADGFLYVTATADASEGAAWWQS